MNKFPLVVALLVVGILGLGYFLLTSWEIPAQSKQIEKVLPDDMFPK